MTEEILKFNNSLKQLLGKKLHEVFDESQIQNMENRNKMNDYFRKVIGLEDNRYSLRISLLDHNDKPFEVIALTQLHNDFDQHMNLKFIDTDVYRSFNKCIFVFLRKESEIRDFQIINYKIISNCDKAITAIDEDFGDIINNLKSELKSKLEQNNKLNVQISSQSGKYLVFKPKDSIPYKPMFSETYNNIISQVNYGWYLNKNFVVDILNGKFDNVKIDSSKEEIINKNTNNNNEKIMDFEFYKLISNLKISSKASISTINQTNDFFDYLFINRPIEVDFINIIRDSIAQDNKKLIFLIGNSGDGKSRLLKYLHSNFPDLYNEFTIHNDATESYYLNRDSIHTLAEILEPFSDEKYVECNERMIIAINLGVIGKFIDSEYSEKFNILIEYLKKSNALKENQVKINSEKFESIEYLSFSEYNNFEVSNDGISMNFINSFFEKIFSSSQENPFMRAYNDLPENVKVNCPVAFNYRKLLLVKNRIPIIKLLLLVHLEKKIIITPRIMWNFIYEILMGIEVEVNYINNLSLINNSDFYLRNLFFNRILDLDSENEIISEFINKSYIIENHIEIDNLLNKVVLFRYNEEDLLKLLNNEFNDEEICFLNSIENLLDDKKQKLENLAYKSLVRYYSFEKISLIHHEEFMLLDNFGKIVHDYNYEMGLGSNQFLKDFRQKLLNAIQTWNGKHFRQDLIYIESGDEYLKKSVKFDMNLRHKKIIPCKNLHSFSNKIVFEIADGEKLQELYIDFSLYQTIVKIEKGYQLTAFERIENIALNDFVEKIIKIKTEPSIQYINSNLRETFIIRYDSTFGTFDFTKEQ